MSDDLGEIKERLDHCESEIQRLSKSVAEFKNATFKSRAEHDRWTNVHSIYVTMTQPIPAALKSQTGMISNELRSCLDSLACVLAIRNRRSTGDVYFPISKSKGIFDDDGKKKIRKLSATDQDLICSLTPYKGGNDALYKLHEADRRRKHVRLLASGAAAPGFGIGNAHINHLVVTRAGLANFSEIGKEYKVAEFILDGWMEFGIDYSIRYAEEPLTNDDILERLEESLMAVRSVVSRFSAPKTP